MYRPLVLICLICATNVIARSPRILNGDSTPITKVPYQASVSEEPYGHVCGASIITKDYILTAGHCADSKPNLYQVRVGSAYWDEGGEVHQVAQIIRHKQFYRQEGKHGSPVHDIALMKVTPPIKIDNKTKRPIQLYSKLDKVKTGDVGLVAGWGVTRPSSTVASKQLKSATLTVIDFAKCKKEHDFRKLAFPPNNFCVKHPSAKKNSCVGDSGGPFVVNGKQAGIVSWGAPWECDDSGLPSVYVDVAKYHDWIHEHVKLPSKL